MTLFCLFFFLFWKVVCFFSAFLVLKMFLDMYHDSSNVVFEKGAMFHFAALKWAVFCFVFVTFMKIVFKKI